MKRRLYCPWRQSYVQAQPEECVRLNLLTQLVDSLGYPASGIVVERELKAMPHLFLSAELPKRRADIVCFASGADVKGQCWPLLLIECKAVPLTSKMQNQLVGYNHYLKAAFVALVNQTEAMSGWFDEKQRAYHFIAGLPSYEELLGKASFRPLI